VFGYVRPVRDELKCKDLDLYRATYCGLCRTIRKRCGMFATMVLNFDFVFLAVLLSPPEGEQLTRCHRCHLPPFRRCTMCESSCELELVADESVILSYWKMHDDIRDERGWKKLLCYFGAFCLKKGYRCAAAARPEFDRLVSEQLDKLHELEQKREASLDRPADAFANILRSAIPADDGRAEGRALEDLMYHLGRWIYLIDARDDFDDDRQKNCYNPICQRFGSEGNDVLLSQTLDRSVERMCAASALLNLGRQKNLIENILFCGIPAIQHEVFHGNWKKIKKQTVWRNNR